MVKMEAFDDPHFMHQTVRVCQSDHTDSINACIGCSFDLKNRLFFRSKEHAMQALMLSV